MKKPLVVVGAFLLISFLYISCSLNFDFNETMEKNWGVRIPHGYKETFSKDSGPSFHGDGWRYNVFYYKENLNIEELEGFTIEKKHGNRGFN